MSLITRIKADALAARKMRATLAASTLTTLLGELETFGKNAGREPTDADVVTFVKKTIKNLDEMLHLTSETSEAYGTAFREKELLEAYLPKQLTETELRSTIENIIAAGDGKTVGDVMKALKTNFNGQYDGALASSILRARFGK